MTNMSMKFKQDFLREFREDPKNSLKKYGIDFSPQEEANFKKEEMRNWSDEQLQERFSKSRFFSMFDFF